MKTITEQTEGSIKITFLTIREQIGEDMYKLLEQEAETEVALAMKFELIDKYRQERYYNRRQLLTHFLEYFKVFQDKELQFTPIDVMNILFEAKLLFATQSEHEYEQRRGGGRFFEEPPFCFLWEEKEKSIEEVIKDHLHRIEYTLIERTLATVIRDFNTHPDMGDVVVFFKNLFEKIKLPFEFHSIENLPEKNIEEDSGYHEHQTEKALISFKITGSRSYVYFYAGAQLRTFLNMLRVAGFVYHAQIDFGMWKVEMIAPSTPYFLSTNEIGGVFSWEEDKKKPWEKIPDGCLFLSFGYRGLTTLFLDNRTFSGIEKFFLDNMIIFDKLKNPWDRNGINDIASSLDILSSATQIPDLGAKILQIYCCLEHLFVPKDIKKDNIKYIIGAINALRPDLIPWFTKLYKIRCDYAHKGYVQRDDKILSLVFESVNNTLVLLTSKLKQS
ncbi:MAG: hypothetical protein KGI58_03505 [Patescibacteria group bacterium]|nr:hypothetical protein [Patescibacteria group bacterium]